MRKKIGVVGSEDMVLGFSLAGVDDAFSPKDDYEAIKIIDRMIESPEYGIILLSEDIAEEIRKDLSRIRKEKELYPVIIEIPDKGGPLEDKEDPLRKKIRRAVGIDITSKEK